MPSQCGSVLLTSVKPFSSPSALASSSPPSSWVPFCRKTLSRRARHLPRHRATGSRRLLRRGHGARPCRTPLKTGCRRRCSTISRCRRIRGRGLHRRRWVNCSGFSRRHRTRRGTLLTGGLGVPAACWGTSAAQVSSRVSRPHISLHVGGYQVLGMRGTPVHIPLFTVTWNQTACFIKE